MGFKQRLLRAEKRCPAPEPNGWPGLQVYLEESKRLEAWLAQTGLTAAEAHKRRMKVPGNTFLTLKLWLEMERLKPEFDAKRKAEEEKERAEHEAMMAKYRQGASPCTSNNDRPKN